MWALRQLFRVQDQQFGNFGRLRRWVFESECLNHDLSNLLVIWHHHCHRPETDLQIVRQFISARVARVHGDVTAHGLFVTDGYALESVSESELVGKP